MNGGWVLVDIKRQQNQVSGAYATSAMMTLSLYFKNQILTQVRPSHCTDTVWLSPTLTEYQNIEPTLFVVAGLYLCMW